MPNMVDALVARPKTPNATTQYTTGFDVTTSAGPSDYQVVTIQAIGRPTAYLLGPGLAAVASQLNTYYGGGKAAQVLAGIGITAPATNPAQPAARGRRWWSSTRTWCRGRCSRPTPRPR
jgi:hypothetical protein